jgi:hypothetical protein
MTASPHSDTMAARTFNSRKYVYTKNWYDIVGQLTTSTTYGPAITISSPAHSAAADSLRVENAYDYEGKVTSTTRKFSVGGSPWALQHTTTYDAAGRPTYKTSPGAPRPSTTIPRGMSRPP